MFPSCFMGPLSAGRGQSPSQVEKRVSSEQSAAPSIARTQAASILRWPLHGPSTPTTLTADCRSVSFCRSHSTHSSERSPD